MAADAKESSMPAYDAKEYGDPLQLLLEDHESIRGLLKKFEQATAGESRTRALESTLTRISIHESVEDELFYPAVREKIDKKNLIDEALREHEQITTLLAEKIAEMKLGAERPFKALSEMVRNHFEKEERNLFPQVKGLVVCNIYIRSMI
jgi:hemerythrin-like domain-containing protein